MKEKKNPNSQIGGLVKDLLIQLQTVLTGKSKIFCFHVQIVLFCPTETSSTGIGQEAK